MNPKETEITLEQFVRVKPAEVYRAFTNATAVRDWLCEVATLEARPGGRLYFWWASGYYASGEFTALEPDKKISFLYHGRKQPSATEVTISLTEKEGGVMVKLVHAGIPGGEEGAKTFSEIKRGWETGLKNLVSTLEEGGDLRITKRPMLGVYIGDFNDKRAAELGVPVKEGVRLEDTVANMGARDAGLGKNDVLVEVDGKPLKDYNSIPEIIQKYQAGDTMEVVFYRGKEKKQTKVILSHREIPEIPFTPEELAKAVEDQYAASQAALTACFEGTSEEDSTHRPAEGEWNAREVLAHLIHIERDVHAVLHDFSFSQERVSDGYADNSKARIQATVNAYGSLSELLKEFKRNQAETITILAGLPSDFVTHKGTFWRMAFTMLTINRHTEDHIEQIKAALKAEKK